MTLVLNYPKADDWPMMLQALSIMNSIIIPFDITKSPQFVSLKAKNIKEVVVAVKNSEKLYIIKRPNLYESGL